MVRERRCAPSISAAGTSRRWWVGFRTAKSSRAFSTRCGWTSVSTWRRTAASSRRRRSPRFSIHWLRSRPGGAPTERRRSSRWEPGRCARRATPVWWCTPRGRRESRSRSPPASGRRSSATSARRGVRRTGSSATSAAGAWRSPGKRGRRSSPDAWTPATSTPTPPGSPRSDFGLCSSPGRIRRVSRPMRIGDLPRGTEKLLCLASNTAASYVLGRPKAEVACRPLTHAALDSAMRRLEKACPRGVARAPRHHRAV